MVLPCTHHAVLDLSVLAEVSGQVLVGQLALQGHVTAGTEPVRLPKNASCIGLLRRRMLPGGLERTSNCRQQVMTKALLSTQRPGCPAYMSPAAAAAGLPQLAVVVPALVLSPIAAAANAAAAAHRASDEDLGGVDRATGGAAASGHGHTTLLA